MNQLHGQTALVTGATIPVDGRTAV